MQLHLFVLWGPGYGIVITVSWLISLYYNVVISYTCFVLSGLGYGMVILIVSWLISLYYKVVINYTCFLLSGLGYGMVIVSWLISLYYNVVISYVLFYLYSSLTSVLPWTTCDNWWNTKYCISQHGSNTTGENFICLFVCVHSHSHSPVQGSVCVGVGGGGGGAARQAGKKYKRTTNK